MRLTGLTTYDDWKTTEPVRTGPVQLEVRCEECDGCGVVSESGESYRCETCRGLGWYEHTAYVEEYDV